MAMKYGFACMIVLAGWMQALPAHAGDVDVDAFIRKDRFEDIKLSPTGEFYAATAPLEDRTVLVIVRRSDKAIVAKAAGMKDSVVDDFWWVNDERVVVSVAEQMGSQDQPWPTGQLHAINVDGTKPKLLIGTAGEYAYVGGEAMLAGSEYAQLIDALPKDPRNILVSVSAYSAEPLSKVERLDVYTGKRATVARAPVRRARFMTDAAGDVRFAVGAGADNASKLYYRGSDQEDWRLLNDESTTARVESPLGFSTDSRTAYLQIDMPQGPDAIVAMDVASGTRTELLRDAKVDPVRILRSFDGAVPLGASFMDNGVRSRFFDETSDRAKLQRSLEKAFPGQEVLVTSATNDAQQVMFLARSDRSPGEFYVYDGTTKRADAIFGRRAWLEPDKMGATRAIEVTSRDSLVLRGYLTLPPGGARKLPLVVVPHGGPFNVFDRWEFNEGAQMLASAGYAVLRINFRGSGNYGRSFTSAGARRWGGKMQDDVTDATRWAIAEGIADAGRICIYGASYGAYAALMGVAREPGLYQCAAGYVGVYDLPAMHLDDSSHAKWGKAWANDWVGPRDTLAAVSPIKLAASIKVPVFLAAGGEDVVAPIQHSKKMEKALKSVGVPVETLYFDSEGHGFYTQTHQREFYTRLLAFLKQNIGGAAARAPAAASGK